MLVTGPLVPMSVMNEAHRLLALDLRNRADEFGLRWVDGLEPRYETSEEARGARRMMLDIAQRLDDEAAESESRGYRTDQPTGVRIELKATGGDSLKDLLPAETLDEMQRAVTKTAVPMAAYPRCGFCPFEETT